VRAAPTPAHAAGGIVGPSHRSGGWLI